MELIDSGKAEDTAPLPPAAARVADELLRRHGLGPPLTLRPAPGGMLNQNLFATTARGQFFLKGYRYAELAPVQREHDLIDFARGRDVPAVAPLRGPGGATALRVGGRIWAVYPLLVDRQESAETLSAMHASSMGRMLGRIHAALATLPLRQAARYPVRGLAWDSKRASEEMAEYEKAIARRPHLDEFDRHALASFSYRRTLIGGGLPPPAAFAGLPSQLVHGDFHEGNVFFDARGEVSGVIDWELAYTGPRALEIVRAMDFALRVSQEELAGWERVRAFLQGYATEAPLTLAECEAMPDLYWANRVHSLWVYEEHYRKGSARTDRLAITDVASLEWWLKNRRLVASVLVDALRSAPTP